MMCVIPNLINDKESDVESLSMNLFLGDLWYKLAQKEILLIIHPTLYSLRISWRACG